MKGMNVGHAVATALGLVTLAPAAWANGGFEIIDKGAQLPLVSQPGLFASALHDAWARAAPSFCTSFGVGLGTGHGGKVTGCDNVSDVSTIFQPPSATTPVELETTLPRIVVHVLYSAQEQNQSVQCLADIPIQPNIVFPLRVVTSTDPRYAASGVIQQVGFDAPTLYFGLSGNQIVWHAPCDKTPPYTADDLRIPMLAALQTALSNLGFPGTVVNDTMAPYAATLQSDLSLHFYTVSVSNFDAVFTVGGSRLSDVKAGSLPLPGAKAATGGTGSAQGNSTQPAAGSIATATTTAPRTMTAPTWSTPVGGTGAGTPVTGTSLRPAPRQTVPPTNTVQSPIAPSALGAR